MTQPSLTSPRKSTYVDYHRRTPRYYLERLDPQMLDSFTPQQLSAIVGILTEAIPQSSPKIVDLRFAIDLIISRFYFVILVGKDRRRQKRKYVPQGLAKVGNAIAVVVLLLGLNLLLSFSLILLFYLLKTIVGIDLLPDSHLSDFLSR